MSKDSINSTGVLNSTAGCFSSNSISDAEGNVKSAESAMNINAGFRSDFKDLTQNTQKRSRIVEQLKNTYYFSEQAAENIVSCAEILNKNLDEINVTPSFKTKVRSFLAKIFQFFGNDSKVHKLHQEGISLLGSLKNKLTNGSESSVEIINECLKNETLKAGLYWILSPELMAMAGGDAKNIPQLLKTNPEAKELFKKEILTITKDELEVILIQNLTRQGSIEKEFSANNQIFQDVMRGYAITFEFEGKDPIKLNPGHVCAESNIFHLELEKQLKEIGEEDAKKIKLFCRSFPTQGVFAGVHPHGCLFVQICGDLTTFTVNFPASGKPTVNVITQGGRQAGYAFEGVPMHIPTETNCEFSFDYDLDNGSGTNIQIKKFEQNFKMNELFVHLSDEQR